jgi:hypothetical protein
MGKERTGEGGNRQTDRQHTVAAAANNNNKLFLGGVKEKALPGN